MSKNTITKFRKIDRGLYGTDTWREIYDGESLYCEQGCECMEVCIDNHTTKDGWHVRYICEHGHFSDRLGEWFPTLHDAKAFFVRHPERVR